MRINRPRASGRRCDRPQFAESSCGLRRAFTSFALVTYRFDSRLRCLGVKVATAWLDRHEAVVKLVTERNPGRYVQPDDVGVADPVEVLDQRPQRVAVG